MERFVHEGFLHIEGAFPTHVAAAGRAAVWHRTGLDPEDPSTWRQPVVRVTIEGPIFRAAGNSPALRRDFDQLVGEGRWTPRSDVGRFVVRFPSAADPGDTRWHVDPSYGEDRPALVNVWSRGRALLILSLFSDVGADDAPTKLRAGSHLELPRVLVSKGAGGTASPALPSTVEHLPTVEATGAAGDVYLCHPFLVHAASWPHAGQTPRFLAHGALDPMPRDLPMPLRLDRSDGDHSPVERAVRIGLGAPQDDRPRARTQASARASALRR